MIYLKKIPCLKIKWPVYVILYCLTINSIVSQPSLSIPKTDSTSIAYYRLNVYEQYRRGFLTQDTLITNLKEQIGVLNSRVDQKEKLLFNYDTKIIPKLENQIYLKGKDFQKQTEIQSIKEDMYLSDIKRLKKGRFVYGVVGVSIGIILFSFFL